MIKRQGQRMHARRRALERYGLNCGPRTRNALLEAIQNSDAVFLESYSNRQKVFAVNYGEQYYPVVYDNRRHEIVTFLPREYLTRHQNKLSLKL